MDILDFKPVSLCYFMDPGLANYYLSLTGIDSRFILGTLNENYVYINLKKRQDFPQEIVFETPAFATYRGGEIDFVAQSIRSSTRYLAEVKSRLCRFICWNVTNLSETAAGAMLTADFIGREQKSQKIFR